MFFYCFLFSPWPVPTGELTWRQKIPMEIVFYLPETEALYMFAHGQGTSVALGTNSLYIAAFRTVPLTSLEVARKVELKGKMCVSGCQLPCIWKTHRTVLIPCSFVHASQWYLLFRKDFQPDVLLLHFWVTFKTLFTSRCYCL